MTEQEQSIYEAVKEAVSEFGEERFIKAFFMDVQEWDTQDNEE